MNRSKFEKKEIENDVSEFKIYSLRMQISYRVYSKIPKEKTVWRVEEIHWRIVSGVGETKRVSHCGRAFDAEHVHVLILIPLKYSVAQISGFIKGKSAIHIARTYVGRRKDFVGQSFWARGYLASTVGRNEEAI